jgi:hypothetical protein
MHRLRNGRVERGRQRRERDGDEEARDPLRGGRETEQRKITLIPTVNPVMAAERAS